MANTITKCELLVNSILESATPKTIRSPKYSHTEKSGTVCRRQNRPVSRDILVKYQQVVRKTSSAMMRLTLPSAGCWQSFGVVGFRQVATAFRPFVILIVDPPATKKASSCSCSGRISAPGGHDTLKLTFGAVDFPDSSPRLSTLTLTPASSIRRPNARTKVGLFAYNLATNPEPME